MNRTREVIAMSSAASEQVMEPIPAHPPVTSRDDPVSPTIRSRLCVDHRCARRSPVCLSYSFEQYSGGCDIIALSEPGSPVVAGPRKGSLLCLGKRPLFFKFLCPPSGSLVRPSLTVSRTAMKAFVLPFCPSFYRLEGDR
jgi:hypothetical protein